MNSGDAIEVDLNNAFHHVSLSRGEAFTEIIKKIVRENFRTGRLSSFLAHFPGSIPENYVWRVVLIFEQINPILALIRTCPDAPEWELVYQDLLRYARSITRRWGNISCCHRDELAHEAACNSTLKIKRLYFPYDTSFIYWTHKITEFEIRKSVGKFNKIPLNIPLDQYFERDDVPLIGQQAFSSFEAMLNHIFLMSVIAQLTPIQQQIIKLRYWQGLSSKEIGLVLGKSPSAVDLQHFYAIRSIREQGASL